MPLHLKGRNLPNCKENHETVGLVWEAVVKGSSKAAVLLSIEKRLDHSAGILHGAKVGLNPLDQQETAGVVREALPDPRVTILS